MEMTLNRMRPTMSDAKRNTSTTATAATAMSAAGCARAKTHTINTPAPRGEIRQQLVPQHRVLLPVHEIFLVRERAGRGESLDGCGVGEGRALARASYAPAAL